MLALLAAPAGGVAQRAAAAPAPRVQAPSAIVVEAGSGRVLFARAPRAVRPIASTTKMMTALLTLERARPGDVLSVAPYAGGAAESTAGLRPGERLRVRDLLSALLLASANEAAVTLARGVAGSVPRFVAAMNARARSLGLRDTSYANPIGLDAPGNASTAADLATLARRLLREPLARRTVNLVRTRLRSGDRPRTLVNRNDLLARVPEVDGVKTGHTQSAGYVLVGSARRRGVAVVSAVLGEPGEAARDADTLALLRYGLSRLRRATVLPAGRPIARIPWQSDDSRHAGVGVARSARAVLVRGEPVRLVTSGLPAALEGPLPAGTRVGSVEARAGTRVLARAPLVTSEAVPRPGLLQRAGGVVWGAGALVAAALVALGVLTARRRIAGGRERGVLPR